MTAFLVAQVQIHDRQRWARYAVELPLTLERYGGEVLATDDTPEVLEGQWFGPRTVIVRFASRENAEEWYRSDEYQRASEHRWAASTGKLAIVEGIPSTSS